jgi:hypothetical protein
VFWVFVFFGAVFGWAFGCQRACGVCSRLLEMADFSQRVALRRAEGFSGRLPAVPAGSPAGGLYPAAQAYPLDALTNTAQTKPYSQHRLIAHDLHYCPRGKFPTLSARAPLFFVIYS